MFLGRLTPVIRSFVSVPAGVFEVPFVRYTLLTLLGLGDLVLRIRGRRLRARATLGERPSRVPLRRVLVVAAVVVVGAAWLGWRYVKRRRRRLAEDSSGV